MKEKAAVAKLYIGIDIHKRSWKIKTATEIFDGKSFTSPPDAMLLKIYVDKHFRDHEVYCAYEAGCCGYGAHRAFSSFGWHSMVVNPADIARTNKSQYQKSDKIDASLICRELKDGRFSTIHIPDKQREGLRCLFRRRNDLIKDFRSIKSTIIMQLLYLGITIPPQHDNSHWTHQFRDWIRDLKFDFSTTRFSLQNRLDHFEFIDKNIREVSNKLRAYCRKHYKKDYYLLKSIPGIGGIVAAGILSEIGDLRRFKNMNQLCSYVGLIPAVHQSGDNYKTSGVTPRSNRLMRSYFVEAAWIAIRHDPVMQQYYRSHLGKDTKRIIIKVARKLLCRTRAVITSETPYEIGVLQ